MPGSRTPWMSRFVMFAGTWNSPLSSWDGSCRSSVVCVCSTLATCSGAHICNISCGNHRCVQSPSAGLQKAEFDVMCIFISLPPRTASAKPHVPATYILFEPHCLDAISCLQTHLYTLQMSLQQCPSFWFKNVLYLFQDIFW